MSEQNASTDATSAAADATSAQSQAATAAAEATEAKATSATDGTDALGDAGKAALDRMKAERDNAKREAAAEKKRADDLELSTKSESEKAIALAKKEGAAEVTAKWSAQVRRSEVKAALTAAGINASVLELAVNAAEFAALKVSDEGQVEGLAEAVTAFRKDKGDLFKAPVASGSADGGNRGTPATGHDMNALLRQAAGRT